VVLGDRPLMYKLVLDRASPELDECVDVLGEAAGIAREGYDCNRQQVSTGKSQVKMKKKIKFTRKNVSKMQ
jgi:hypothetical protein